MVLGIYIYTQIYIHTPVLQSKFLERKEETTPAWKKCPWHSLGVWVLCGTINPRCKWP